MISIARRKTNLLIILSVIITCYLYFISDMYMPLKKVTRISRYVEYFEEAMSSNSGEYLITFVTAFIDIGPVQKGGKFYFRGKDVYYNWMREYRRFNAPLVIYTNDPMFLLEVKTIRENFTSITKFIFLEDIYSLHGFRHLNRTEVVFANPDYPKIYGVTTNAKYTCVMHSKYDFLEMSIKNNYFNTEYFAWTDIGSLRNMAKTSEILNVRLPPQFNDSRLAFNKVFDHHPEQSFQYVMTSFSMWLAGGFILGKPSVFAKLTQEYRKFVDRMIDMNLMSTDESILFAMYTDAGRTPEMPDIQEYYGKGDACDYWFHLMYLITNHSCLGNNTI